MSSSEPPVRSNDSLHADGPDPGAVKALILSAQQGDRVAAEELIRLHEPMVVHWVSRRLGRPLRNLDDTRDILHDAYAIVLTRVGDFNPDDAAHFGHWLRAILHRVLLRKCEDLSVKRREALPADVAAIDPDITVNTRMSVPEIEAMREKLLEGFSPEDRLIWRERTRGVSAAEIAEKLKMTDRNIRLRFAKVDASMRVRLQRALGEATDTSG